MQKSRVRRFLALTDQSDKLVSSGTQYIGGMGLTTKRPARVRRLALLALLKLHTAASDHLRRARCSSRSS